MGPVSLCVSGVMSECSAENVKEQEKCQFFKKCKTNNRCFFNKMDDFCDCIEAQVLNKQKKGVA